MNTVTQIITFEILVETVRNLTWDQQAELLALLEEWVDEKEANMELSDETKAKLAQAELEAQRGETVSWENIKADLDAED